MSWLFQEPRRDPQLGEALRQLENLSQVDDAELRQRIMAAAAPRLVSLRSPAPRWWEWVSRWMPVAVPVGLAASLVAGLLLPPAEGLVSSESYTAEAGADSALVIAAFSEAPAGGQLTGYLVTPEGGDWLLEQAVTQ
jgi:anti-sigma factor RsiW